MRFFRISFSYKQVCLHQLGGKGYITKNVYGRSQAGPSISPAFYRKITVAEEETILTNKVFHISVSHLKEGIK